MNVTSLDELKEISKGEIIELIGFNEKPFFARVKRPSFLNLAGSGAIPNELLTAAHMIFNGKSSMNKESVSMAETNSLLRIVAKKALVEPSYEQLEDIGLELTDLQLLEIYNYTQQGVRALNSFRKKQKDIEDNKSK